MKSDACSGMNSQMNTLTNTVNGFSSSIQDHESRISDLELSSGGLYKAIIANADVDIYLPTSTTGTFMRIIVKDTYTEYVHVEKRKTGERNIDISLYNWALLDSAEKYYAHDEDSVSGDRIDLKTEGGSVSGSFITFVFYNATKASNIYYSKLAGSYDVPIYRYP